MTESLLIDKSLDKKSIYEQILPQIESVIRDETNLIANLANISAILKQSFHNFSWVGFYIFDGSKELILGPFQGELACTRIPIGKGVCGTSAKTKEKIIVPDVTKYDGHIACSSKTQSEIVLPLIIKNQTRLVLDVDSEKINHFDDIDARYLEKIVDLILKYNFL